MPSFQVVPTMSPRRRPLLRQLLFHLHLPQREQLPHAAAIDFASERREPWPFAPDAVPMSLSPWCLAWSLSGKANRFQSMARPDSRSSPQLVVRVSPRFLPARGSYDNLLISSDLIFPVPIYVINPMNLSKTESALTDSYPLNKKLWLLPWSLDGTCSLNGSGVLGWRGKTEREKTEMGDGRDRTEYCTRIYSHAHRIYNHVHHHLHKSSPSSRIRS